MQCSSLDLKNQYYFVPQIDWKIVNTFASTDSSDCSTLSRNSWTDIRCCSVLFIKLYNPAGSCHSSFCQKRKNTYWGSFQNRESLFSSLGLGYSLEEMFTLCVWNSPNLGNRWGKYITSKNFWRLSSAFSFTLNSLYWSMSETVDCFSIKVPLKRIFFISYLSSINLP